MSQSHKVSDYIKMLNEKVKIQKQGNPPKPIITQQVKKELKKNQNFEEILKNYKENTQLTKEEEEIIKELEDTYY